MQHVIVFSYIFTILIGACALTIQCLADKESKGNANRIISVFVVMLLIMNSYDFFVYYSDNIITQTEGHILLSLGDCLISVLVFLWLSVERNICMVNTSEWPVKIAKHYVIAYAVIWVVAVMFFAEYRWIRLIIDIPLIFLLAVGGIYYIVKGRKSGVSSEITVYSILITFFMAVNYLSYFIGETQAIRDFNENILDMTIFYWLVINAANLFMTYRHNFVGAYGRKHEPPAATLESALDSVKVSYDLTIRETEILSELYAGKTNTQIAENLFISESTVKAHMYNIFKKLNVKHRIEAVGIIQQEKEK